MKRIMILKPNQDLELVERKLELEDMQEIVGGYIEFVYIDELNKRGIDMIVNEEGKFIDECIENIALVNDYKVVDVVMGNVIFAANDGEGNTIGLNDRQINYIKKYLFEDRAIVSFTNGDGEKIVINKIIRL